VPEFKPVRAEWNCSGSECNPINPSTIVLLSAIVGFGVVLQHIPTVLNPSLPPHPSFSIIWPPERAHTQVMELTSSVVKKNAGLYLISRDRFLLTAKRKTC